jgi:hypothetical protein
MANKVPKSKQVVKNKNPISPSPVERFESKNLFYHAIIRENSFIFQV